MYLHIEDRELFRDIIITVSEESGLEESIVEKDYYVTIILKLLVEMNPEVVFKGGTSLSKAYKVINRFSEDIDITFEEHIGEARRKKIKYRLLKKISEVLELPIENWDSIESDKDYNHYDFTYETINGYGADMLRPYVKLETALMSYAYPTEERNITSVIYEHLKNTDMDIVSQYGLEPFNMKTQSLTRTLIDKLFAICDYYMLNKPTRNSRHLYDVYQLCNHVDIDESLRELLEEVREHRASIDINVTPSARRYVDILGILDEIVTNDFYKKDYEESTKKLISDNIEYEMVVQCYSDVIRKLFK